MISCTIVEAIITIRFFFVYFDVYTLAELLKRL